MANVLDRMPFDWADPAALKLRRSLTELYPNPEAAQIIAAKGGVDRSDVAWGTSAKIFWQVILDNSSAHGQLRDMIAAAAAEYAKSPYAPFLTSLLEGAPDQAVDAGEARPDASAFRGTDDTVAPESLLFLDDLMLQTGRIPWLISTLQNLMRVAPAVCKLSVKGTRGSQVGTGFRISADQIMTNWHVTHFKDGAGNEEAATTITVEFGFEDKETGGTKGTEALAWDQKDLHGNAQLDWSVLRLASPPPDDIPIVNLKEAGKAEQGAPAFVIQHPMGGTKRLAYVRNQITEVGDPFIAYLSDTQGGSSGAPVFDDQGRVVALHRAGGTPQVVAGREPVKKNEGVRMDKIVEGLIAASIGFD